MLTKLKYVGVRTEDLLDIYSLFIRSRAEYCAVAFHSSLTQEQSKKIENIQKTSFKIILQDMFIDYPSACEMTGFPTLFQRRENRALSFAKRCLRTDEMAKFFPLNPDLPNLQLRDREQFIVNFAHGEKYKNSAIPNCQRILNIDAKTPKSGQQQRAGEWREWMSGLEERLRTRREERQRDLGPGGGQGIN